MLKYKVSPGWFCILCVLEHKSKGENALLQFSIIYSVVSVTFLKHVFVSLSFARFALSLMLLVCLTNSVR